MGPVPGFVYTAVVSREAADLTQQQDVKQCTRDSVLSEQMVATIRCSTIQESPLGILTGHSDPPHP